VFSVLQVVVAEMLDGWGPEGFEAHVRAMQAEYAQRAAVIQAAAERHLVGLAEWQAPAAGMFLWLRLLGIPDARSILDALKDSGVVLVPGAPTYAPRGILGKRFVSSSQHAWRFVY
jgi:kynurenine/2-aminoadipate aminotransferase